MNRSLRSLLKHTTRCVHTSTTTTTGWVCVPFKALVSRPSGPICWTLSLPSPFLLPLCRLSFEECGLRRALPSPRRTQGSLTPYSFVSTLRQCHLSSASFPCHLSSTVWEGKCSWPSSLWAPGTSSPSSAATARTSPRFHRRSPSWHRWNQGAADDWEK